MSLVIYIAVMAGVTYLIRMIPFTLFRRQIRSRFICSLLYYLPYAVLSNPLVSGLQVLFSLVFIIINGISCSFSRNNLRRGLVIFAAGLVVSLATWLFNPAYYVRFGILHFLGAAILIYSDRAEKAQMPAQQ